MLFDLVLVAGGLAILMVAGDKLVDFASALAEKAHLTPAVIGLTVVAAGTSMPELFVSTVAAIHGKPDIAVANVVGSNIANIALILGVTAVIIPIPVEKNLLRLDYPFMLVASWVAFLLLRDGTLDRLESGFFLVSMLLFTTYSVWLARQQVTPKEEEGLKEMVPDEARPLSRRPLWFLLLALAASCAALGVGARLLVEGASSLASRAGISDRVIGLTIVSVGTSLPEVVASLAAALKREHAMAVTGVVGSNIFNLLLILGAAGTIQPIPISEGIVRVDCWVMLGFVVLLVPLLISNWKLTRIEGGVLLGAYAAYVGYLVGWG